MLLLGRILDGASGGNILVAQAYVADVTKPEHQRAEPRAHRRAFGFGFVLGPLLGGLLLKLPVNDDWKLRVPFLVAAGFSTLAWVLVATRLPESIAVGSHTRTEARVISWRGIADLRSNGKIGGLVAVGFLGTLAFAALEGTFSRFLQIRMRWNAEKAAYGFAFWDSSAHWFKAG